MSNWEKLKAKLDAATGTPAASPAKVGKKRKSADVATDRGVSAAVTMGAKATSGVKRKRGSERLQSATSSSGSGDTGRPVKKRHAAEHAGNPGASPAPLKPLAKVRKATKGTSTDGAATPDTDAAGPTLTSTQPLENAVPAAGVADRAARIGKYLALDCEMVGVGGDTDLTADHGKKAPTGSRFGSGSSGRSTREKSCLARVSLTNYNGHVVYDSYVSPEPGVVISDYRTWVSGIRPHHLYRAPSFASVQAKVQELVCGRVLVGHALGNDFKVLGFTHPRHLVRDTSLFPPFKKYATGKTPGLKKVAAAELKLDIQGSSHSSVEDARACMLLYRKYKAEFESGAKK